MIDYREILRLDSLGYSRRRISSMVNSSHHTVEDTLKAAHAAYQQHGEQFPSYCGRYA